MKVFVTKYGMTQGILLLTVQQTYTPGWVVVKGNSKEGTHDTYYVSGEWFTTRKEAVENVLQRIANERVSIVEQLAKLDAMEAKLKKEQ